MFSFILSGSVHLPFSLCITFYGLLTSKCLYVFLHICGNNDRCCKLRNSLKASTQECNKDVIICIKDSIFSHLFPGKETIHSILGITIHSLLGSMVLDAVFHFAQRKDEYPLIYFFLNSCPSIFICCLACLLIHLPVFCH